MKMTECCQIPNQSKRWKKLPNYQQVKAKCMSYPIHSFSLSSERPWLQMLRMEVGQGISAPRNLHLGGTHLLGSALSQDTVNAVCLPSLLFCAF